MAKKCECESPALVPAEDGKGFWCRICQGTRETAGQDAGMVKIIQDDRARREEEDNQRKRLEDRKDAEAQAVKDLVTQELVYNGTRYGAVLVEILKCKSCECDMVHLVEGSDNNPFTFRLPLTSQIEQAGRKVAAWAKGVCAECYESGEIMEKCQICEEDRKPSEIEETIGGEYHLCKSCFATVSAKKWEDTIDDLREQVRWESE